MNRDLVDVTIVGAGPTGLTLAAELRRRGLAPVLLDRLAAGANTSRAAVVHSHTLEGLEPLGVVPTLMGEGMTVPVFELRDRDHVLVQADFTTLPTKYNHVLMCPQDRTEAVLLARLEELGGTVERPAAVAGIETGDTIRLSVEGEGAPRTIETRWLVGCDGMHSTVREAAGIGFVGGAYKESFVLADVHLEGDPPRDKVSLFLSPDGLVVLAPLPDGRFRFVATLETAPEAPSREDVQAILDRRGPRETRLVVRDIVWSSRFHVHHRVAERLRAGNILLCGDAAHVHSPAGGQGMNTGIQDAMELGAALADVVGGASLARLDAWETRRHRIAQHVVKVTDRLTRAATARSMPARLARNGILALAGRLPAVGRAIAYRAAGLDLR